MAFFMLKEKPFTRKWFISYSLIILGAFILAAAFVFFITPYKIVPGGVYGISIVLHYMFNTPVGLVALCFDIPLTIIGVKILGPRFGFKTVLGFSLTAVFTDTLTWIWGFEPLVNGDALLSSIFGGVLAGLGLGMIFKSKATSGGTDIVAMIIAKYTKLPLGILMIYVDSVIVLVGLLVFQDWKIPLYSWIVIFITGKVIDVVLEGVTYDKSLFIISDKHEEIRDKIITNLNRGGTYIDGKGMYNMADRKIIFTVVSRRELAILEEFIHEVDPKAFLTVTDATEILGEGFKSLKEKVGDQ
ncbi:MAG: YitT family protein [Bacteroidales bacterium]|nr:YitT family protein [Bacteroidales bacterium]HNW72155.1 YitT family protein [Bacteroidales bacterium]HPS49372.1 YitT family protein [Bacteroidales bacterium]